MCGWDYRAELNTLCPKHADTVSNTSLEGRGRSSWKIKAMQIHTQNPVMWLKYVLLTLRNQLIQARVYLIVQNRKNSKKDEIIHENWVVEKRMREKGIYAILYALNKSCIMPKEI